MGCGPSKEEIKNQTVLENVENPSYLKSSAEAFITVNLKKFTEVYKVGKSLGTGAYGEVRLVTHKVTNQERAAKIFRKESKIDSGLSRTKSEISILKKLSHPIIIKIFEYFEDEKRVYLILEKCNGGELFDEVFKNRMLSESIAAVILKQLFSVVAYLHEMKVVHRDLKPENILLEDTEDFFNVKIIDFGTASFFKDGIKMTELVGSSFYIAPEVTKYSYTEKCDEWSCGAILYVLLCGNPPFPGNTDQEVINNVRKGLFSLEGPIWDRISHQAKDLIKKLLCPEKGRITAYEALSHPWIQAYGGYPVLKVESLTSVIDNLKTFHSKNKLRDAISAFISSQVISTHEIKDLRELFKSIDTNGDGKLSIEELKEGLTKANTVENIDEYIQNIMNEVDTDGNGYIDYNEFLKASISESRLYSKENLRNAFKLFDLDGSGKISSAELQQVFSVGNVQSDLWRKVVMDADQNSDGEIDFEEFCSFIAELTRKLESE